MHLYISPRSGARGYQKLQFLKYYNVLEWESGFTLGMDAANNTNYIKKSLKQKLFSIKFPTKTLWTHISIFPWSVARGLQRLSFLKSL